MWNVLAAGMTAALASSRLAAVGVALLALSGKDQSDLQRPPSVSLLIHGAPSVVMVVVAEESISDPWP